MRTLTVFAILVCYTSQGYAQHYDTSLVPYRAGSKWGYCDPSKKIILEPQFNEAGLFEGSLAHVKVDSTYCLIDRKGNVLYSAKWGIPIITDDGRSYITTDVGHAMVFDEHGTSLTKPYASIGPFNKYGYAEIMGKDYVGIGIIDDHFKEVLQPRYRSIDFLSPGLVRLHDTDLRKYALCDLRTQKLSPFEYDELFPLREGLLMARKDDSFGFINEYDQLVIPFKYQNSIPWDLEPGFEYPATNYIDYNIDGFYGGLAVVCLGNRTGYINKQGDVAIPFDFEKGFGFKDNRAWVKRKGKWGMIDNKGRFIIKPRYRSPQCLMPNESSELEAFHEGVVLVARGGECGYADTTGDLVIPRAYSRGESFCDGLAAVQQKGEIFFIDHNGKRTVPSIAHYTTLGEQAYRMSLVRIDASMGQPTDLDWWITDTSGTRKNIRVNYASGNEVHFTGNIASVYSDNDTSYVFDRQGTIICQLPGNCRVVTSELVFSYDCNCYMDIKRKIRYCE